MSCLGSVCTQIARRTKSVVVVGCCSWTACVVVVVVIVYFTLYHTTGIGQTGFSSDTMFSLLSALIVFLQWRASTVTSHQHTQSLNNRPIIGVVAQDTKSVHGTTYIPVTYVSFLQQAGARVVPIRGGQPKEYYDKMVNMTNGILFPGGAVSFDTSLFGHSVKHIFHAAVKVNKEGGYFPLWGTCMGFQIMCYMAAGVNYLKKTDSRNLSLPLKFTPEAASSRLLGSAPQDIQDILQREPVTQNQHQYSILVQTFKTTMLSSFFKALSTNRGRAGVEFISTIEAKEYPFYGVQWHPEKNNFNWNPNYDINHDDHAVKVSQYMADFFVSEARKSTHRFPDVKTEATNLIQNYKRIYFDDCTFYENYYID